MADTANQLQVLVTQSESGSTQHSIQGPLMKMLAAPLWLNNTEVVASALSRGRCLGFAVIHRLCDIGTN